MSVEVKRIKERLKAKFPKVNLSKKRIDEISARLAKKPDDDADDTAIDEVIQDANDFMPFEDIAREDDRVRNLEKKANQKQDPNPSDGEDPKKPSETNDDEDDDVPKWAKSLMDSNKKLSTELQEIKKGKVIETKTKSARELFEENETFKSLKDKNKDFFFRQINVESETPVEEQIESLESEYKDLVQTQKDNGSYAGTPPASGTDVDKPSDEEVDSVVENL